MPTKNPSLEANLAAAKAAARQMQAEWMHWKKSADEQAKLQCIAKYAAAYTSCVVYIENYLKHLYPTQKVPAKVTQDVRNIVSDMEAIEKMNDTLLQKVFKDIDQLAKDAA
ncbi:MAG: hypothetical protein JSR58_01055 [Verrucomicrobia bacterium]|nr:hypothetical protein [Verrucomicrobiota bacterium]